MILQTLNSTEMVTRIITEIIGALILFLFGYFFTKSYNHHRNWDSSKKNALSLNGVWLLLNFISIIISLFINLEIEILNLITINLINWIVFFLNILSGFFIFKKLYGKEGRDSLISILLVQIFLFSMNILINLIIVVMVIGFAFNSEIIDVLNFIVFTLILIGLVAFYIQWGDQIQLIDWGGFIFLGAFIPGMICLSIVFLIEPDGFFSNSDAYLSFIISFILAQIGKVIAFKTIPEYDLEKMTPLEKDKILLKVENLKVYYPLLKGMLKRQFGLVKAVDGVSFHIKPGETVGLVGESGCGKTTIALTLAGLIQKTEGNITLDDELLPVEYPNDIRKKIQMVFQDPDASMNPRMKVVDIISEPLKNILGIVNKQKLRTHVLNLMDEVSLKLEHLDRYPHEFSGGQKQRVVVARALVCNPELILLDEPTSALDVSVQAQILNLLKKLQDTYNFGFLFITHDLSVVKHIADRVAVMYLGKFVEVGDTEQVFSNPSHPYTKALLVSRSKVTAEDQQIKFTLEGDVPSPIAPPPGCAFNPRCYSEHRSDECWKKSPHKIEVTKGHYIWCVNEEVLNEENDFL